jgi:hypothetical protein
MENKLQSAIRAGNLQEVQTLVRGGESIAAPGSHLTSALCYAALLGEISIIKWLLEESGANVSETDYFGHTALLVAAKGGLFGTVQCLLEHGSNIADATSEGYTIWDLLKEKFLFYEKTPFMGAELDPAVATALLRVMVLRSSPPKELTARLLPEHRTVVQEGAHLRTRLPAYLARRRALLDENCPLIGPLQALVIGYEKPTTTEELWATGLGAA